MIIVFGLSFLLAALLAYSLNWLALIPWRKASSEIHWTEKVALLYPARVSEAIDVWLITGGIICVCHIIFPRSSPFVAGIGGYLGTVAGGYSMDCQIFPDLTFRPWLHLATGHLILSSLWWLVVIVFAAIMPATFDRETWLLFCLCSLIQVALYFGLGLRLLKLVRLIRSPSHRISAIVAQVSKEMGIPVRATWVWRNANSNAVAFTTSRELAFTEKLLETLSDEELRAVCAHELGHLAESRLVAVGRFVSRLWILPFVLIRPIILQYGWDHMIAVVLLVWLIRALFKRLSRAMETRADKIAVGTAPSPTNYAHALESMYRINQVLVVMPSRARGTHPDLYDRLVAVGAKPAYSKPIQPTGQSWTTWLMVVVTLVLAAVAYGK